MQIAKVRLLFPADAAGLPQVRQQGLRVLYVKAFRNALWASRLSPVLSHGSNQSLLIVSSILSRTFATIVQAASSGALLVSVGFASSVLAAACGFS